MKIEEEEAGRRKPLALERKITFAESALIRRNWQQLTQAHRAIINFQHKENPEGADNNQNISIIQFMHSHRFLKSEK